MSASTREGDLTPVADMRSNDQAEVERQIVLLAALSDDRFADALADNIMDPVPDETAAFRSAELVKRSEAACSFLIQGAAARVSDLYKGADADARNKRRRVEHFKNKMAYERAILRTIITESDARNGLLRNRQNPRARAMKRLAQLNLAGDVPRGTYRRLLDEETEKDAERRRQQKREARVLAKEKRAGS
ncbi:MAG: hypothetical protein ACRCYR_03685 [Phycicoccus sp.]